MFVAPGSAPKFGYKLTRDAAQRGAPDEHREGLRPARREVRDENLVERDGEREQHRAEDRRSDDRERDAPEHLTRAGAEVSRRQLELEIEATKPGDDDDDDERDRDQRVPDDDRQESRRDV